MRSARADDFNHDPHAAGYDADVQREEHPIRAGYGAVHAWLGRVVPPGSAVLDLGCGTGNTALALPEDCRVVAVDLSQNMLDLAREKLAGRVVTFHAGEILEYVHGADLGGFDVVTSCYALHHLTADEKLRLFDRLREGLGPGARVLIGDLMIRSERDQQRIIEQHARSHPSLSRDFEDEYFWHVDEMEHALSARGWATAWTRLTDLSWTLSAAIA